MSDQQLSASRNDTIRIAVIKSIRAQSRTTAEVARNAGIDRNTLYRYLAHKRDLTGDLLGKVMRVLRVHVARCSDGQPIQMMQLQTTIKHYVAAQEWSPADLAQRTDLDRSEITRYLDGERDLTGRKLSDLLQALDLMVLANLTKRPVPRDWLQPIEDSH